MATSGATSTKTSRRPVRLEWVIAIAAIIVIAALLLAHHQQLWQTIPTNGHPHELRLPPVTMPPR